MKLWEYIIVACVLVGAGVGIHVLAQSPPLPAVVVIPDHRSVTLAFDPSPDDGIGSYRLHRGETSGNYNWSTNVGLATQITVGGLIPGTNYFFAVTAIGTNQLESDFSNEIQYTPQDEPSAPSLRLKQMLQVIVTYEGQDTNGVWEILGEEAVNITTEKPYGLFRAKVEATQVDMIDF